MVIQVLKHHYNTWLIIGSIFLLTITVDCTQQFKIKGGQINWKTPLNEPYSTSDTKGYYHKEIIEVSIPSNIEGNYFVGIENESIDGKRFIENGLGDKLLYYITTDININYYMLDWPYISSDSQTYSMSYDGSNLPIERVPIYIWVEPRQLSPPGKYHDKIKINIYAGDYQSGTIPQVVGTGIFSLNLDVSKDIQLSIGDPSFNQDTQFKVEFDQISKGQTLMYDVFVDAIDGYDLKIKSKNNGMLRHDKSEIKTKVNYELYIDNKLLEFNELGEIIHQEYQFENSIDSQHKIKMILGDAKHAFKGKYFDQVSIEAISNTQ